MLWCVCSCQNIYRKQETWEKLPGANWNCNLRKKKGKFESRFPLNFFMSANSGTKFSHRGLISNFSPKWLQNSQISQCLASKCHTLYLNWSFFLPSDCQSWRNSRLDVVAHASNLSTLECKTWMGVACLRPPGVMGWDPVSWKSYRETSTMKYKFITFHYKKALGERKLSLDKTRTLARKEYYTQPSG